MRCPLRIDSEGNALDCYNDISYLDSSQKSWKKGIFDL